MARNKRVFLIDGMNMAFRNFFALGQANLTTSSGQPVSCILGTALFMNKLLREEQPDYLAILMDSPEPTFRHEQYEDYKGTRDDMPDDLESQLPFFEKLLEAYGCKIISKAGYEADDLIGTLAKKFSKGQHDIYIVSGDKDFCQLVNDHTFIYSPKKGQASVVIDANAVEEKFSCKPDQVVDCLAIIGDKADNIPGVSGIGIKGAGQLIKKFGSLDQIYKNLNKIKSEKQRNNLLQDKEQVHRARELITIDTNVPLKTQLKDYACDPTKFMTNEHVLKFYQEFEFNSLVAEVEKMKNKSSSSKEKKPATPKKDSYIIFSTKEQLESFIRKLNKAKSFAFYLNLDSDDYVEAQATAIEFSIDDKESFLIDLTSSPWNIFDDKKKTDCLQNIFYHSKAEKITHNLKRAIHALSNMNVELEPACVDLEIMDYLLDPNTNQHELKICLKRYLNLTKEKIDQGESARYIFSLYAVLQKEITKQKLTKVFQEIETPIAYVLAKMERAGLYIDCPFLKEYSLRLQKLINKKEREIYEEAGEEFNISSPKQLQAVLYDKLKIHEHLNIKIKKTKTGFSTDESMLVKLSKHNLPNLVLEFRSLSKLKNTYVDPLTEYVHPNTKRIHTNLRQTVTATGRLSSDSPNLQNIPMRTEMGREIRKAFVAQKSDSVMISADYSQIEIRLMCHFAKPSSLSKALHQGYDIHLQTAAEIFSLPPEKVSKTKRAYAKAINFGIIYGMGPRRLSQEIQVPLKAAKEFIEKYFETYPQIKLYSESLIKEARNKGYCTTITGRRRALPGLQDDNSMLASRAENMAVNTPLQGSAADLIKIAMIKISNEFEKKKINAKMLLQIHDELLFECHKDHVTEAEKIITHEMENAMKLSVPLKVEINHGKNWLAAHG